MARIWVILGFLQVFLVFSNAQEEVEFPEEDVAAVESDYDAEYVDVNEDTNYMDYNDYEEKTYDYELEKEPVLDVIEEEEDILEDLDSVAMDEAVTLSLSDETTTTTQPPPPPPPPSRNVFITLVIGGFSPAGPVPSIEVLSPSLGVSRLPSLPVSQSYCSAAFTGRDLISCTSGRAILTPYGWVYTPGSCFKLSLSSPSWQPAGGSLTSYRKSSSTVRVGRFLLAMGGYRPKTKRRLRSVEVFDSRTPDKGWRRSGQLTMPVGVSQHCSVVMKGATGKEVIVTGGKGREDRVIKLSLTTGKWYSLTRLEEPRRQHACTKVTLNGRKGLVVSGGMSGTTYNLTSVEFYDVSSGQWVKLPDLQRGRRNHAMMVEDGRLMVTGGMKGRSKKEKGNYLRDSEVFDGKRWVDSEQLLRTGRQGFSVVKVPVEKMKVPRAKPRSLRLPRKRKE